MVGTCQCPPMEGNIEHRVNLTVNCGLRVMMKCQYRLINGNKCITLVGNIGSMAGKGYGCVKAGVYRNFIVSAKFFCEHKTALKSKVCVYICIL